MTAVSPYKLPAGSDSVNSRQAPRPVAPSRTLPPPDTSCARCSLPWHLGAVREGEDAKRITFAQLEALARGTFSASTLRTYSTERRGVGMFYKHMTKEGAEVRYSACESNLVILRQKNVDTSIYEAAIAAYDRKAPTTRRIDVIERLIARDQDEFEALRRAMFGPAWMSRWQALNSSIERIVRWVDDQNREFGFTREDGFFVTDRFTNRKKMLRSLLPELSDEGFASLWRKLRLFLKYEGGAHLLRDLGSLDADADRGDDDSATERRRE